MGLIENPKTYTGRDLETIFFRPMLTGDNAEQIGIRVLYNMPVPTTIQMWSPAGDILKPYSSGWTGGDSATRKQKTITMQKIKAETGYSASDYFSQVYELITGRPDVNMDDLSGTELEKAETEMFRAAIAESLRATMWVGDMADTASPLNKFDGFMALIRNYNAFMDFPMVDFTERQLTSETVVALLDEMWRTAPPILKSMKGEGNLAYFVTTDVIDCYERYLDRMGADGAYNDLTSGRRTLSYHGIPLVDINVSQYLSKTQFHTSFCLLTDRRNLTLAVNTSDYPGTEVRMWYNPDEMENRQRAVFMVGCEILDEDLLVRVDFV